MLRLPISPSLCRAGVTVPVFMAWNKEAPVQLDHLSRTDVLLISQVSVQQRRVTRRGIFFRNIFVMEVAVVICRSNTVSEEKQVLKVTEGYQVKVR